MERKLKVSALLLCLAVLAGLSIGELSASKALVSPSLSDGQAGDSSVFPAMSSSTVLSNAMNPFDGVGVVYGVHLSSGALADFIVFRDSDTANSTSAVMTSVQFSSSAQQLQFNPPLRIFNGLSVNASNCLAGIGANAVYGRCYTVLYDVP